MTQYRYEAHIVPGMVWDDVKLGGQYLGGEVVDGVSGMNNDLVLIVSYPADSVRTELILFEWNKDEPIGSKRIG